MYNGVDCDMLYCRSESSCYHNHAVMDTFPNVATGDRGQLMSLILDHIKTMRDQREKIYCSSLCARNHNKLHTCMCHFRHTPHYPSYIQQCIPNLSHNMERKGQLSFKQCSSSYFTIFPFFLYLLVKLIFKNLPISNYIAYIVHCKQ